MSGYYKLKRGLNVRMKGEPGAEILNYTLPADFALVPQDFRFITPKTLLKPGDKVKAGTPVFYSKDNPRIRVASPVSGTLKEIRRGERRVIEAFIFESDGSHQSETYPKINPSSAEEILKTFDDACLWPYIIQRPYGIIANPEVTPRDIFISGFDTSPLAPDTEVLMKGNEPFLQSAVSALSKLTKGKVYISLPFAVKGNSVFEKLSEAEIRYFSGPHPSGTAGVQIHHIAPVNKGETVWTLTPESLVTIGKVLVDQKYDVSRTIALAGSGFVKTGLVKTIAGALLTTYTKDNLTEGEKRIISGHVLCGRIAGENGYLGYNDRMITAIPEGNFHEFLGWALPGFNKFSHTRTFFSWLASGKKYDINTNYHGGERALVMTGEYEKVVPMDIYPQHLVKAIMIKDIELMEKLGIYEVVEEDFALCDFVCTSKTEVQHTIRTGIEMMIKEMS
jgi:Na+-transporting NADH:ubiquinone oxidoreductase subunit A